MRIEEIGQKVETFVKSDKGKIAIIGGFGGLFLISYMMQKNKLNNSDYEEGVPLSKIYTSYPTVDANSETVIDAIENQIRNEHQNTQDYINDALVKLQENQSLNTVPNNTLDYDQTYSDSVNADIVGYQTASINARAQLEKQLVSQGLDTMATSNGQTLGQNVALLGTNYKGSVVNQVGTNGDGSTTIHTQDGKSYTIPKGQSVNSTSESTNPTTIQKTSAIKNGVSHFSDLDAIRVELNKSSATTMQARKASGITTMQSHAIKKG